MIERTGSGDNETVKFSFSGKEYTFPVSAMRQAVDAFLRDTSDTTLFVPFRKSEHLMGALACIKAVASGYGAAPYTRIRSALEDLMILYPNCVKGIALNYSRVADRVYVMPSVRKETYRTIGLQMALLLTKAHSLVSKDAARSAYWGKQYTNKTGKALKRVVMFSSPVHDRGMNTIIEYAERYALEKVRNPEQDTRKLFTFRDVVIEDEDEEIKPGELYKQGNDLVYTSKDKVFVSPDGVDWSPRTVEEQKEASNIPKQDEEDAPDFDQAAFKRLRDEVAALLAFVKGGQQNGVHNFKNVYVPADKLRSLEALLKGL